MLQVDMTPLLLPLSLTQDDEDILRKPGDRWLIRGPLEYIPPAEVEVMEQRHAIPLAENEGIYVRDIKTGKVSGIDPAVVPEEAHQSLGMQTFRGQF